MAQFGHSTVAPPGPSPYSVAGRRLWGATHHVVDFRRRKHSIDRPVGLRGQCRGVFAQPSNIGQLTTDLFAVIPEVEGKGSLTR